MNRAKIQHALQRAAEKMGLTPILSTTLDTSTPIKNLPAIWLPPLELLEIQGQFSGRIEYQLKLSLIYDCRAQGDEDKVITIDRMESEILSMLNTLRQERVAVSLYDIEIEVSEKSNSKVGDLTLNAEAKITSYF